MYTEYVFENKKYEVASREIKATLFDIVAQEEEKIGDLREKAFVEENEASVASELQALYVQQDSFLREILAISDKLTKALQRVDSCSRKLKQIENKTSAQTIVRESIAQNAKSAEPVKQEQVKETAQAEPVMVTAPEPVAKEEPIEVKQEAVSEVKEGEAPTTVPDIVMSFDDDDYAARRAKKAEEKTEAKDETELLEPVITVTTDAPVESTSAPLIVPTEEPVMVAEEQPVIQIVQEEQPVITPTVDEQPVNTDSDKPLITPVVEEQPTIELVEEKEEPVKSDGDVLIPISTDFEKEEQPEKLVLKKRSTDAPKVIMISGKQAKNLKGSLETQEALLSAKGFFKKDDSKEQPVINDASENDVTAKQEQIEEMMNQANELYAAGKVDEAQSMMNQVSTLNQELQGESAGMSK